MNPLPVLYSFRRCPYAIRTRMTLKYCGIEVEHREVLLKDKPEAMLAASPKGTVPVLVAPDKSVLDESLDIIQWALAQQDQQGWLDYDTATLTQMRMLVGATEARFKPNLDRYKYNYHSDAEQREAERNTYRVKCVEFLNELNDRLEHNRYLMSDRLSYVDVAVFPFVRQFANVEPAWFDTQSFTKLQTWLRALLDSELFLAVMQKHKVWAPQT